ncbi:MAG: hypothetical protein LKJ97_00005, partial [Succiniclasticum sp.]|jgi:hypothetical protein|nr:hypothetical protein [Succiniclasticum sp.]
MAQIVAKAMAKGANVDKLAAEFADELDALGVRVAALEKKSDNTKITGQIRYSYSSYKFDGEKQNESKLRTRLIFTGKVNDNWDYVARLQNVQDFASSYKGEDDDVKINRAFMTGRLGGLKVDAGRAALYLADGMVYDSTFDGVAVSYGDKVKVGGYYGKLTESFVNKADKLFGDAAVVDVDNDKAWGVNASAELGKVVTLFAGYDKLHAEGAIKGSNDYLPVDDNLAITNAGLKFNITDDVKLTGAYLHTNTDYEENGWYAILDLWGASYAKPGSFGVQAVYYDQPALSAEAHTMDGDLNDWLKITGFKGYSVAASYTVAKNMMATVKYYDLKSRDDSEKKDKTLWSEFQLRF